MNLARSYLSPVDAPATDRTRLNLRHHLRRLIRAILRLSASLRVLLKHFSGIFYLLFSACAPRILARTEGYFVPVSLANRLAAAFWFLKCLGLGQGLRASLLPDGLHIFPLTILGSFFSDFWPSLTIFLATDCGTPAALATLGDAAAANISLACCLDLKGNFNLPGGN